jgi:hypothetical protein
MDRKGGPSHYVTHSCENCDEHFTYLQALKQAVPQALELKDYHPKTEALSQAFFKSNLDSRTLPISQWQ